MSRRRAERGQTLVLSALLVVVLIGFVGLVVDGGEAAAEQQTVRNAADGAALAGAYSLKKGSTIAAATTLAGQVLTAVSLPAGDLAMTYLDSGGSVTAVAANVATVRAVVTDQHRTFFLGALGVNNLQLTATAEARPGGSSGTPAPCALCVMGGTGPVYVEGTGATVAVTGARMQVNADLYVFAASTLTAPSITLIGSNNNFGGTITPAPTGGSLLADPLSGIAYPSVAGAATAYTAPLGSSTLAPGVYSTITVPAGANLTLNAGTFVVTTSLAIAGTLNGSGVTIFLACSGYPTPCASGASGGLFNVTSGAVTLSPPSSGTYAGLTVFADRNNRASNSFSTAAVNVGGTWYTLLMNLLQSHAGDTLTFGQMLVAGLLVSNTTIFSVNEVLGSSYGGAAGGGLSL